MLLFSHLASRIGYSRRKYRDPCRKVLSLLISMRVDRYYDKRVVWDKVFADNISEQYEHLSYEAVLAVNINKKSLIAISFMNSIEKRKKEEENHYTKINRCLPR